MSLARPWETRAPLTAHQELASMSSHDMSGTEQRSGLGVGRLNAPHNLRCNNGRTSCPSPFLSPPPPPFRVALSLLYSASSRRPYPSFILFLRPFASLLPSLSPPPPPSSLPPPRHVFPGQITERRKIPSHTTQRHSPSSPRPRPLVPSSPPPSEPLNRTDRRRPPVLADNKSHIP